MAGQKTKKITNKKQAAAEKATKTKAIKDKQTRVEILQQLSDRTGLKRVEVEAVFDEMAQIIKSHMKKQGSGEVLVPKLGLKIRKIRKKATKKRVMVSPLTGQEVVIAAKPVRDDVKVIALKPLKEAILG